MLYFNYKTVKGVGVMSKVKYLTKGNWLFVIVLLGCLIYSFFTSKSSTLLLFFQALATAGCYFILKKDLIPKSLNQKGKIIVLFIWSCIMIASLILMHFF